MESQTQIMDHAADAWILRLEFLMTAFLLSVSYLVVMFGTRRVQIALIVRNLCNNVLFLD